MLDFFFAPSRREYQSTIASLEVELKVAKAAFAYMEDHAKLLKLKCETLEHRLKQKEDELEQTLQANERMTNELRLIPQLPLSVEERYPLYPRLLKLLNEGEN